MWLTNKRQHCILQITTKERHKVMKLVMKHMFEISIEKCREYRFGVSEGSTV